MKKLYAVIAQDTRDNDFDVMEITFSLEEAKKETEWLRNLYNRENKICGVHHKAVLCTFPYLFQQEEATEDAGMLYDAAEDWYSYGEYEAVNF